MYLLNLLPLYFSFALSYNLGFPPVRHLFDRGPRPHHLRPPGEIPAGGLGGQEAGEAMEERKQGRGIVTLTHTLKFGFFFDKIFFFYLRTASLRTMCVSCSVVRGMSWPISLGFNTYRVCLWVGSCKPAKTVRILFLYFA